MSMDFMVFVSLRHLLHSVHSAALKSQLLRRGIDRQFHLPHRPYDNNNKDVSSNFPSSTAKINS